METSVASALWEKDKEQNLASHFVREVEKSLKHLNFLQNTEQNFLQKPW